MPSFRQPIWTQPEFDDVEITTVDVLFLKLIAPVLGVTRLVTMPPRMHRTHRLPRRNYSREVPDSEWQVPEVASRYVEEASRALRALGFGEPRTFSTPVSGNLRAVSRHSFHPADRSMAAIHVGTSPRRFVNVIIAFQTWWNDGSRTATTNVNDAELFPTLHRPRGVDALSLPDLDDVRMLYAIHRRRAVPNGRTSIVGDWNDPDRNPGALARRWYDDYDARIIESGLYEAESSDVLRLTWKGAILMTWVRCPPFETLLKRQGKRRTERAVKEMIGDR